MYNTINRVAGIAALAVALAFSAPALAVTTVSYTGVIDNSTTTGYFPNANGVSFNGSFVYNENAGDLSGNADIGLYNSSGSPYGATLSAAGYTLNIPALVKSDVYNNDFGVMDQFKLSAEATGVSIYGGIYNITIIAVLMDLTQTALSSDALVQPIFGAFGLNAIQIFIQDTVNNVKGIYDGSITSMSVAAVPLPAGIPLLGAGVALLGFLGWRKKRAGGVAATA